MILTKTMENYKKIKIIDILRIDRTHNLMYFIRLLY